MFISAEALTEDLELDWSSVCKNYLEIIDSFLSHLFTQFQGIRMGRLEAFFEGDNC